MFRWSRRRSACSFCKNCRIFFLQYRSHHMFMSGKWGFFFFHCSHCVRIASLHWFSVRMVLFSFRSPRPLRRMGTSMFRSRHTARWSVNVATTASILNFLANSSCERYMRSIFVASDAECV